MALMLCSLRSSMLSARVRLLSCLCLLSVGFVSGCDSSSPTGAGLSVAPTFTSGDYLLTFAPGTASALQVSGALNIGVANAVSGTLIYNNPQNSACGQQLVFLTGNINNNTSVLKLTSAAFANSTATLTLQLPLATNTTGATVGTGTVVISGGSCAFAAGTLQAQLLPSLSGTWSGTLGTTPVSLLLTEQPANPAGQFPITASGSGLCNSTQPFTASGLVTGPNVQVFAQGLSITASLGSASNSLDVSVNCATGDPLSGTLTH